MIDHLTMFQTKTVAVVGDVMLDRFIYGSVDRISPEAPIPVLTEQRSSLMLGGAANVARNLAHLGGTADIISLVGADLSAQLLREEFAHEPRIRPNLVVDAGRHTTEKTRFIGGHQQILRLDRESREPVSEALGQLLLEALAKRLPNVDVVILSDYNKGVLTQQVVAGAIAMCAIAAVPVIVDPKARSFEKYAGATILTPNRLELQVACGFECLTDEAVVRGANIAMAQAGCSAMVVTRGERGMTVVQGDSALHVRTQAREVFDVSGAGDTVIAALALAVAAGLSTAEAAQLANAAAGVVVGKYGTATLSAGELSAALGSAGPGAAPASHSLEAVKALMSRWRSLGQTVAFTNGCFDLLHPGHISLLEQARGTADRLVVGLNSDASVRRLKGPSRPVQNQQSRAQILGALSSVDAVVVFDEETPLALIQALLPDVLVKGADYTLEKVVGADVVLGNGGRVVLAELVAGQSTTRTIDRLTGEH